MGPRKNNATAAGKDDGAALGKMRKINPTVTNATAAISGTHHSAANSKQGGAAGNAVADLGYTGEERAFLESQLALFHSNRGNGAAVNASNNNNNNSPAGASASGTDFTAMTKERWMAGLPLLLSATEKLLRLASEQYQITCKNRAAAAAAQPTTAGVGGVSLAPGPSNIAHDKEVNFAEMGRQAASHATNSNMSITDGVLPTVANHLAAPRPTPAAGTAAQFAEENAYILAQAQQLQWYPFTYQRWVELLLDPGKFHTAKDEGRLRGDAIQASLRRCILVTYPAVEGGDCI